MPDLPARPDLDQLRNQAKDLLHAAQRGDPAAIGRISAVSGTIMLSAAQLAVAREYGFASWARLKLEVERRDILNSRDLSRLTRLLAEHPRLAAATMEHWCDHPKGTDPLSYIAMLRFDHQRLGLPRELPGTGVIARALIEAGAPVDGYPGDKETPLITAASYGDAEVARVLIGAGADLDAVSAPDYGGVPSSTALVHAAVFGMTEVLDVLVAAGARVDSLEMAAAAGDVTGWPLGRCTMQSRLRALVFAAQYQRLEVIDQLIAAGTPVNQPDAEWGRLPLHTAAGDGRAASVRRLLAHGADPDLRDPLHNRTALEECQVPNRPPDSPAHDEVEAILRPVTGRGTARQPGQDPVRIRVTITGSGLPGRDIGPGGNFPGAQNIHVAIQRRGHRDDLLGLTPGNAPSAHWTFEATATPTPGGTDIKGPYIQGRPGARFIYLSWGTIGDDGTFTMFRRAKLWLDAVDPATLDAARRYGSLNAHLELTDTSGHPLCAAVRPPLIRWSAAPTG